MSCSGPTRTSSYMADPPIPSAMTTGPDTFFTRLWSTQDVFVWVGARPSRGFAPSSVSFPVFPIDPTNTCATIVHVRVRCFVEFRGSSWTRGTVVVRQPRLPFLLVFCVSTSLFPRRPTDDRTLVSVPRVLVPFRSR
eukprot:scaffold1943_cov343-Pavlova_lutheri.AAC.9